MEKSSNEEKLINNVCPIHQYFRLESNLFYVKPKRLFEVIFDENGINSNSTTQSVFDLFVDVIS